MMSVTSYTLIQIKGTRLEALFSGRWVKLLSRDINGRVFMDINPKCFGSVVDYLNELKIAPPECASKVLYLGEEENAFLWQIPLAFRLRDNCMDQSNRLGKKINLVQYNNGRNDNSKAL